MKWKIEKDGGYIDIIHCQENVFDQLFLSYDISGNGFCFCTKNDLKHWLKEDQILSCPICCENVPDHIRLQIKLLCGE